MADGGPRARARIGWALGTMLALAVGPVTASDTVVVLLFDGLAPVLIESLPTPNLDRLRNEGAWTHGLEPVFPSVSFPSQVSLSTGCEPGRHGIVGNAFLDPQRGRFDHAVDADWLTGCELLHVTAERQGVRAAALGWVGSRSESRGELASWTTPPRGRIGPRDDTGRAREVVRLLRLPPEGRPGLILAYFTSPDEAAHRHAFDSSEVRDAMAATDARIGSVLTAVDLLPDGDRITVLVTSDHGMREVAGVVNLHRILDRAGVAGRAVSGGTTSFVYLDDPATAAAALERLSGHDAFTVHRSDALPVRWPLGSSARLGDLVVSARPPYFIEDPDRWPSWARWLAEWGPEVIWSGPGLHATHGYDAREVPSMTAPLYVRGPEVAVARHVGGLRSIDLYPTVCHLLGIEPAQPIDGELARALLR